jgi:hypothetical protein
MRIAIGCRLRRALRGRGLAGEIAALLDVLRDPEPAIALLARRLRRGFRRCRGGAVIAARMAAPHALGAPAPAFANSS